MLLYSVIALWIYGVSLSYLQCLAGKKVTRLSDNITVSVGGIVFPYKRESLRLVLVDKSSRSGLVRYELRLKKYGGFYPLLLWGKVVLYTDMHQVIINEEVKILEKVLGIDCIELLLHDKEE